MTDPKGTAEIGKAVQGGVSGTPESHRPGDQARRSARWTIRRAIELLDQAIDAAGDRTMRTTDPPEWGDVLAEAVSRTARRSRGIAVRPQISPIGDEPDVNHAPSLD